MINYTEERLELFNYFLPDKHHTVTHWDYNPRTDWNTKWQNIPFRGDQ